MKNKRIINCFILSLFLFLFSSLTLNAASGSLNLSGKSDVYVGENVEITLSINNLNDIGIGIGSLGGVINYDKNYLEYVSHKSNLSAISLSFVPTSGKFAGMGNGNYITNSTNLISVTFKTKQIGRTTVSISGTSIASGVNSDSVSVNHPSKSINITNPPSSNTNLSSLSASGTNISTGNLTANVGKDVTSTTINATAEDSKASVSGTGTKSLNYGKNTFTVTVKAENGTTKNYTITINREDPRSNNANLSSLKVSGQDLSPGFNKNTTTYSMTVPFSVSSLDIKTTTEDSNAKVSITGNKNLPAEATTPVTIKVTAENGTVKTYTINVTREKDPNKPKSNNNYLTTIGANIGILSPVFDKEKLNYVIYLPYEIDKIELTVDVEDKQYGVLETSGPETLNVGTNRYEFKVTAEDGTTRSYIVNVIRGANVDASSSNVLLKDLKIENGNLDKAFNSEVNVYRYEKDKNFNLTPIPEDENTKVTVLEHDDVYTILLETSNGETNVYTLIPKEENVTNSNTGVIIAIILASLPLISGGTFFGYKYGMKKMLSKVKALTQGSISTKEFDNVVYEENPKNKKSKKDKKKKKDKQPEETTTKEKTENEEI